MRRLDHVLPSAKSHGVGHSLRNGTSPVLLDVDHRLVVLYEVPDGLANRYDHRRVNCDGHDIVSAVDHAYH